MDTIKEKQEDRFDEAKDKYIGKKIEKLFLPSDEAENSLRMYYADNFLSGLISNAEFTHDPEKFKEAFVACLAKTNDEAIKQYVDNLLSDGEITESPVNGEERAIFGEKASDIRPEVRAYVHGLIASTRATNGERQPGSEYREWIKQRLDGLEPMNVENVERALAGYHVKGLQNFEKGVDEDGKSTLDKVPKAVLGVINRNHEVQRIYQQRMAEAMREISDDNKRAEYRKYFLAQVNRLGVENVNDIRSIASPDLWNYGADTLGVLPEGAQPMTGRVPSAATEVAKRLAARCKASDAETGQVFAFTQDGQIYYARYSGGRNVQLYKVPGGADLSSEMPNAGEEESGDRSMQTTNATVESTARGAGAEGNESSESLSNEENVKQFNDRLLARMNGLRKEVKDKTVRDVDTLAIHLDTALRMAARGLKDLKTVINVGGEKFNVVVPENGSPMVSGNTRAAAETLFRVNQPVTSREVASGTTETADSTVERTAVRAAQRNVQDVMRQAIKFVKNRGTGSTPEEAVQRINLALKTLNRRITDADRSALRGQPAISGSSDELMRGHVFSISYNPRSGRFSVGHRPQETGGERQPATRETSSDTRTAERSAVIPVGEETPDTAGVEEGEETGTQEERGQQRS